MPRTISSTYTSGLTLTSTADNPITITGIIDNAANFRSALYSNTTNGPWTIMNSGTIAETGMSSSGVNLTNRTNPALTNFTNLVGGVVSGTKYGITIASYGTVTNFGTITGGVKGVRLSNQGNALINEAGAKIQGGAGVNLFGTELTLVNAGTIIGTVGPAVSMGDGVLQVDPGAVFQGAILGSGAGTEIELATGSSAGTLGTFESGGISLVGSLQFDANASWTVLGNSSGLGALGTISGFANSDTIDLLGFSATSSAFVNNVLTLTDASSDVTTLNLQGAFTTSNFMIASDGSGGTDITLCFLAGTRIATPSGEVPIEHLAIGDMVLTQRGDAKPIFWIGRGKVLATRGQRSAATPVRVRKGALADKVPRRDLRVTKGHSLYLDGALIPAEFLVNHRSIVWDDRAGELDIYHIELATHDVLLANGAPAETYRDDGNRWLFQNANSGWGLPPREPCAPVLTGGPVVDAVWRRLLDRAGPRPTIAMTDEADLHLMVDGQRIDGRLLDGGRHRFRLPDKHGSVRIRSRAAAQDELGLARDPRTLGVALRQAVLSQRRRRKVLEANDETLCDGFHAFEPDNGFRWTNGNAELPASLFDGFDGQCDLKLYVASTTHYRLVEDPIGIAA